MLLNSTTFQSIGLKTDSLLKFEKYLQYLGLQHTVSLFIATYDKRA